MIERIDADLSSGQQTISGILTDTNLMHLHSLTGFREIIRKHAVSGPVTIVSNNEPGIRITIEGTLLHGSGEPVQDALVYVYQTSDRGWYADTAAHINVREGDRRHARLFGYMRTDEIGSFSFHTIRPRGYPKTDLPAHVHIEMWYKNGSPVYGVPGELLFEEDERLTPARRLEALQQGFIIAKNTGSNREVRYEYQIVMKDE
jgi:protocatechuate 3,4-dioxygenase beta subunit